MKYERPGKATVVTPCETIDGPYVQFKDGTARRILNEDEIPIGLPIDADWPKMGLPASTSPKNL